MARTFHTFDLIIAGAGPAGVAALKEALRHSTNVVLVDAAPLPSYLDEVSIDAFIEAAGRKGASPQAALQEVRRRHAEAQAVIHAQLKGIEHYKLQGDLMLETPDSVRVGGRLLHSRAIVLAPPPIRKEAIKVKGRPAAEMHIITPDNLYERRSLPPYACIYPPEHPLAAKMAAALGALGVTVLEAPGPAHDGAPLVIWALPEGAPDLDAFGIRKLKLPVNTEGRPRILKRRLQIRDTPIYVAANTEEAGRKAACNALQAEVLHPAV